MKKEWKSLVQSPQIPKRSLFLEGSQAPPIRPCGEGNM